MDSSSNSRSETWSSKTTNLHQRVKFVAYNIWLHNEIYTSKRILEDNLGIKIKGLALPYGTYNETVRKVALAGYQALFTYESKSQVVTYTFTEKLLPKTYTVVLSARVEGRKVETRWNFIVDRE